LTDTHTLTRSPNEQPPEPKTRRLEMSATQLIGGALAAMTAAVIGARLGVAGTVFGAAIGSLVAGAAGSLYTASLKHTRDKLTSAFVGRVGQTDVELTTVSTAPEVDGWVTDTQPMAAVAPPSPDPVAVASEVDRNGRPVSRWPWKAILVSTAAVFLLAIAGLTAFELVSGQSVSGGQGTTITQVGESRSGGTDTPTKAPSSDTSSTPSTEPSATPSTEPSAAPSTGPSQSTGPTTEPTPRTQASTSTEPSTNTQPSTGAAPSTAGSVDSQVGSTDTGTAGG
jgi:hypothetical protein